MVAKTRLEVGGTVSISPMDLSNSGRRSRAYKTKICGKDRTDWKAVTKVALEDLHADSAFFASNPSRALPTFDEKGKVDVWRAVAAFPLLRS
jgi:hypothetical protein